MGLLERATARLRAWWQAFLAPAPDPRQTLADAAGRQRELLLRVRHARCELLAAKGQLESRVVSMLGLLETLEERARRALAADREDVARLALERRWALAREVRTIEEQARDLGREGEQLAVVEERLATRIAAFDARQQTLAARTSAADAHARIAEALAGLSTDLGDLGPALEEAERTAERSQARAAAIERLVETDALELITRPGSAGPVPEVTDLERAHTIDEQLARLRRETRGERS